MKPMQMVFPPVYPLSIEMPIENRPCSPTSLEYVEQPRVVTLNMAEDSDIFEVKATAKHASKKTEDPKRPIEASYKSYPVASVNAPKRRRISYLPSLVDAAEEMEISPPPLLHGTPRPKLVKLKQPNAASKKFTENRPPTGVAEEAPKKKSKSYINRSHMKPKQKAEDANKGKRPRLPSLLKKRQASKKGRGSATDIPQPPGEVLESDSIDILGPSATVTDDKKQHYDLLLDAMLLHRRNYYTLQNRLNIQMGNADHLEERLSQHTLQNKVKELRKKYFDALIAFNSFDKHCETQKQIGKTMMDKQKAELKNQKAEIGGLKLELSNMQNINRDLARALDGLELKLKLFQGTNTELLDQKNNLIATLNELVQQLKFSHLDENDRIQISLGDRIQELETAQISLIAVNEDYARELELEKTKSSLDRKALKEAYEIVISSLTSTSCQRLLDLKKLSKSYEDLKEENLQLSLQNEQLGALKAAIEQNNSVSKAEQEKMRTHAAELGELQRSFSNLQKGKKKIASKAKIKVSKGFQNQEDKNKVLKGTENEREKKEIKKGNKTSNKKKMLPTAPEAL